MEKTKIILRDKLEHQMNYPVPSYIKDNMDSIMDMAEVIQLYHPEMVQRFNRTKVNLWCAGSSGSTVAAIIATYLLSHGIDTLITYVHKDREQTHSEADYCGCNTINIIVDDFICSGNTVKRIHRYIETGYIPYDLKDTRNTTDNVLHMVCVTGRYEAGVKGLDPKYIVAGRVASCYQDHDKYERVYFSDQLELELKA